jgi:type II secretory pathway pseudopilin PulG
MSAPRRRGFSLPEILIGLFIMMTLLALAAFSVSSLGDSSKERILSSSARLFDETYRARLAYDLSVEATSQADVERRAATALETVGPDVAVSVTNTSATFTRHGISACLTFTTDPSLPGQITPGSC